MKIWSNPTAGNTVAPGGAINLNELTDVVISTPEANQILKYDGATFINGANNIDASQVISGTLDYARLPQLNFTSGDAIAPFISAVSVIRPNASQSIEINGSYFTPITFLEIPNTVINSLVITPNKITASITTGNITGSTVSVTLKNGEASNNLWAGSIQLATVHPDPYVGLTGLFIKGQGANDSTSIIDSSLNPKTILIIGNTKISTDQSKYNGSSIYFDGSGDYLSMSAIGDLSFTTDTFTWECWVRFDQGSLGATPVAIISTARSDTGSNGHWLCATSTEFRLRDWASINGAYYSLAIEYSTWYHVACQKIGSTAKIWINGVPGINGTITATNTPRNDFLIGFVANNGGYARTFKGFMSHIRTTKAERYTGTFDPEIDTYLNI